MPRRADSGLPDPEDTLAGGAATVILLRIHGVLSVARQKIRKTRKSSYMLALQNPREATTVIRAARINSQRKLPAMEKIEHQQRGPNHSPAMDHASMEGGDAPTSSAGQLKDPVCGMTVTEQSPNGLRGGAGLKQFDDEPGHHVQRGVFHL